MMKAFLTSLHIWLIAFWESVRNDEEFENIEATGWSAIYNTVDGEDFEKRPLVSWQLTYRDGVVITATGQVFVDNRPPFTESASSHPRFVGYEREISTFDIFNSRLGNYESLNEWG